MPSIPLPFVVSLVLCLLLVRMVRQDENRLGLFPLLVAAFAFQAGLSGLHWNFQWPVARLLQPIVAAVLPALCYVAFDRLRHGSMPGPLRLWPHLVPAALVAGLVILWREPIDLVLFLVYLGYGLAMLWLARRGPGVLAAARLGDERTAHLALLVIGLLLVASSFIDVVVSLDIAYGDGQRAATVMTMASVLWLVVAGYAATVAEKSRPPPEAEPMAALPAMPAAAMPATEAETSADDAAVMARINALMQEQKLYRDPDLTLDRLARRAGVPARQISSALNRIHGRNVSQIVNEYRVEEARRRLVETRDTVTSVMFDAGFGTKSNFNREFRRVTGMSPSAYRRSSEQAPARQAAEPGREAPAA